ncbi:SRPBCC family protein [Janibacter sp. GS2]|uniref:SRPBCC family protein n=1 Tax=Janibacter sp. GS2 TaxID=3442646 RepID=UPI003EBED0F7
MSRACFRIDLEVTVAPEVAWVRLWDLRRHSEVIPLTRVTADPPARVLAQAVEFRGRTGVGPLGFDDTMRVDQWRPPVDDEGGHAVVGKTGRVLGGRIVVDVDPVVTGSRVSWRQSVHLPWLPTRLQWLEPLAARAAAPGYRRVLRRLLA